VSGAIGSPDYFRIVESTVFDARTMTRVVDGTLAGCIFRGVISPEICQRIAANFWKHPCLRTRNDNVPAYFLGAYHYGKATDTYLAEADLYRGVLHDLFDGCNNVFADVMGAVGAALAARGISLRPAAHEGRPSSEFVMRSWSGSGAFSLAPHEDSAQLTSRLQRGFEIQRVAGAPLVAVNMCVENPSAGELHYWNIEPDDETRARLGLEETGYPYPVDSLEGIDKVVVPIRPGDVYCFNGKLVHAVAAPDGPGYRSTISYLMGACDPETVIYWS
jgi:hypothetical protein